MCTPRLVSTQGQRAGRTGMTSASRNHAVFDAAEAAD